MLQGIPHRTNGTYALVRIVTAYMCYTAAAVIDRSFTGERTCACRSAFYKPGEILGTES